MILLIHGRKKYNVSFFQHLRHCMCVMMLLSTGCPATPASLEVLSESRSSVIPDGTTRGGPDPESRKVSDRNYPGSRLASPLEGLGRDDELRDRVQEAGSCRVASEPVFEVI